ncbi:MAG TPA: MauE/DoxX family redox-associated membrane protein [Actinomycetota bacterium]|nr:MauE/DoxX family redox-associated membrane protein [Actinomycetota bacterium]
MAATITPVVHGGRRTGWAISVGLHALGAGLAAAAFGAVLGGGGALLGGPWGGAGLTVVAAVAVAYAAREAFGLRVPIPERRRQVPEWWRGHLGPHPAALVYGLGLGVGFLTYLRHGTLVAVSALAIAAGDPALGALLLAPFGLARALALTAVASARTSEDVRGVVDRLERIATSPLPRAANGIALAALAALALAAVREVSALPSLAAAVLAGAFAWAAAAKLLRWKVWRDAIPAYRPGPLEPLAAVAVPLAETAVVALVVARAAPAAGVLALVLLAGFSLALIRARTDGEAPCTCFGRRRVRSLRVLLARNAALAATAALALGAEGRTPSFPAMDPLPAALSVLGTAAAVGLGLAAVRWLRPPAAAGDTSGRAPASSPGTPARTGGR